MWAWQRIGKPCLIGFIFLHMMHAHVAYCILHTYIFIQGSLFVPLPLFLFFVMLYVVISIQFDFHNCRLNKKLFLAICNVICLCPLILLHCYSTLCLFMFFSVFSFDSKVVFFLPLILWYCCFLLSLHLLHVAKCSSKAFFVLFMWHELLFIHSICTNYSEDSRGNEAGCRN